MGKMRKSLSLMIFVVLGLVLSTSASARSLYLNGTDISSARGQELKKVNVIINEHGDIFIIAPHYQVQEEDSYIPLSKFVQGMNLPKHKAPQKFGPDGPKAVSNKKFAPVKNQEGQIVKAGDPLPNFNQPVQKEKEGAKSEDEQDNDSDDGDAEGAEDKPEEEAS